MAIGVLRPDTADVVSGKLRQGLYLLDDGLDRTDCEPIWRLKQISDDHFLDSGDLLVKKINNLAKIANKGDVLMASPNGLRLRTYLSTKTITNTLLVTESCDNRCSFCSQPPKNSSSFFSAAWAGLDNFKHDAVIGVSGGEPTFYWEDFIDFCKKCTDTENEKSFHVLTHGRNFSSPAKVQDLVETGFSKKALWGIPLHGHTSHLHDSATNVTGSFFETLNGLIQLSYIGAWLEVRVIVTQQNYRQLPHIARLIASYLAGSNMFVALMSLEPIGWAKTNYKKLVVEPSDVAASLVETLDHLKTRKIEVRLYNFPHCHIPIEIRPYANKSISDWKNYFPKECNQCRFKEDCCGFFSSAEGARLTIPEPIL